jgi:hypothetical protein
MGYVGQAPAAGSITASDITDGTIANADIASDAAIALSKTALSAGTGITLSTNTLNVDAAQSQITTVGTIGTGAWQGTPVTSAYINASQTGITSVGALNAGSITSGFTSIDVGAGAISATGVITGGGLTVGSAVLIEAELEMIDGITAGTAAASKAVVLDGSKNIATIGTISSGAITATGVSSFATAIKTPLIEFTDGDDAITIVDGGGVTFAQAATFTGGLTANGDVTIADAKVIKLGGTRPADDEPATNNTGYGVVILFDAGAAVAIGDAVSIGTDGRVIKTVADATGTLSGPCIGIATTAAGSADDDVYVMTHGIFRHDDWALTAGSPAYIEEADPGDLSATAPNDDGDYVQRVGVAVKDDVLLVMPSIDVIEHA